MFSFQAQTNLHHIEVFKKPTPLLRWFYILNQRLFTDSHFAVVSSQSNSNVNNKQVLQTEVCCCGCSTAFGSPSTSDFYNNGFQ